MVLVVNGSLLAGWYSRWCLRRMYQDAKRALESSREQKAVSHA